MKNLLLAGLLCGVTTMAFAQFNNKQSAPRSNRLHHADTRYTIEKYSFSVVPLGLANPIEKEMDYLRPNARLWHDNMPCLKPAGKFTMPVHAIDPAFKSHMPIERFHLNSFFSGSLIDRFQ